MRVALVYDRVNKWGGAERVLLALHRLFPDAPLYTSVYRSENAPWAEVFAVRTSFLQHYPFAASSHEYYAPLMPLAFEGLTFDEYDLVISVTSEAAKGIITKPQTKHICYLLTPTRYLWSGYEEYFSNPLFRAVSYPAVSYLRTWDKIAATRPDKMIAISDEVRKRIKKYYGEDAAVIYPPLMFDTSKNANMKDENFFLVVSRLVPYKRVDLAIQAANKLQLPLKIVGVGSEEEKLKQIAGPTVEFLGSLTDEELVGYYKRCSALLFPGREDFGLTMVEALQCGKPVIAYDGGSAREILTEGKTGLFFPEQTVGSLTSALKKFPSLVFSSRACKTAAERFSFEQFQKNFMQLVTAELK